MTKNAKLLTVLGENAGGRRLPDSLSGRRAPDSRGEYLLVMSNHQQIAPFLINYFCMEVLFYEAREIVLLQSRY